MTLRAVLFDVTGTLIEPAEDVGATYSSVAAAFGVEVSAWRLGDAFRRVLRHAPSRFFPGVDAAETAERERAWWRERVRQTFQAADSTLRFADFDAFFAQLFETFASGEAWRLRPGARQALREIRAMGLLTGVVSNFDYRLPNILEDLEISGLLNVVTYPQRCGAAKPDLAIFSAALAELELPPAQALYLGHDPEKDLAAATAAGLLALDVAELTSLAELPARLDALATLGT